MVSWCWEIEGRRYLIAINLSDWNSQARIRTSWSDIRGKTLCFDDLLSGERYSPRDGTETVDQGLYVELTPWAFNVMSVKVDGLVGTERTLERNSSALP
jgi:hypothetical protein